MDEEELIVSQRDLTRMHLVRLTLEGGESVPRGAELLGLSTRQVKRLFDDLAFCHGISMLLHDQIASRLTLLELCQNYLLLSAVKGKWRESV